jgi:mediator of RNA polymerase II transcription subunit 6
MQGLEFVVAAEPSAGANDNGVFVIRKQRRRKGAGRNGDDEIIPLANYFVIGENIYMAPSVGDVLGTRMLSSLSSLTKFFSTASSLPIFNPSSGHTYYPPVALNPTTAGGPPQASVQASKESTPMPGSLATDSQPASQVLPGSQPGKTTASADRSQLFEARSLEHSFALSLRYGGEYMDEAPLAGEPGSFILSASQGKPRTDGVQAAKNMIESLSSAGRKEATPQPGTTKQPGAVERKSSTGPPSAGAGRGGAGNEKGAQGTPSPILGNKKRRKSTKNIGSPAG